MTDVEQPQDVAPAAQPAETPKPAPTTEQAVRNRIAAAHGLSEDVRDLFLLGTDTDALEATAAALVARGITGPREPRRDLAVPSEGQTIDTTPRSDRDARQAARALFTSTD